MGGHQHVFALADVAHDGAVEEGGGAVAGALQALAVGRRRVVAAAPDVHLFFAIFGAHVVLVQAGEVAVVALVQGVVADDGNVQRNRGQDDGEGVLSAAEAAGVGDVDADAAQPLAGGFGLFASELGERDVDPAGESVFKVPK